MPPLENIALRITIILGLISIGTVIFYAGYNYRTLQSLRKTAHELSNWKQGLIDILDIRYIRKDMFDERLQNLEGKIDDIYNSMEKRKVPREPRERG